MEITDPHALDLAGGGQPLCHIRRSSISVTDDERPVLACEVPLVQLLIPFSPPLVLGMVENDVAPRPADYHHLLDGPQGIGGVINAVLSMHDIECIPPKLLYQPLGICVDGPYRRHAVEFRKQMIVVVRQEIGCGDVDPLGWVALSELCQRPGPHIEDTDALGI